MREYNDSDLITRRDEGLLSAVVDDELVGMSVERGVCYGFNPVATRIWDLLEKPARIGDLCEKLVDEYDVEPATCRAEVVELLESMQASGLIDVAS